MMTQRQAWLYLAKLWSKAAQPSGLAEVRVDNFIRYYLCHCIDDLGDAGTISPAAHRIMDNKIYKALKGKAILAPLNLQGAKVRAAFCRKMARALRKPVTR